MSKFKQTIVSGPNAPLFARSTNTLKNSSMAELQMSSTNYDMLSQN